MTLSLLAFATVPQSSPRCLTFSFSLSSLVFYLSSQLCVVGFLPVFRGGTHSGFTRPEVIHALVPDKLVTTSS